MPEKEEKRIPAVSISIFNSPWSLAAEVGRMSVYRKKLNPKENYLIKVKFRYKFMQVYIYIYIYVYT
jgi:hypothetical protein